MLYEHHVTRGAMIFILYEEKGTGMQPKSRDGMLIDYGSMEVAEEHRKMFAVPAAISDNRVEELLRFWNLKGVAGVAEGGWRKMLKLQNRKYRAFFEIDQEEDALKMRKEDERMKHSRISECIHLFPERLKIGHIYKRRS